MNFYAFNIGDYASATTHLTPEEDLFYRRLMDAYYQREQPIPREKRLAYRLVRASTPEHREAVDSVLSEFFVETAESYRHPRCEEEIAAFRSKSDKAATSARRRWGDANAKRPQSEGNANASEKASERMKNGSEGNAPNPNPNPNQHHPSGSIAAFDDVDAALRKIPGIENHSVYAAPVIAPIMALVDKGYDLKSQIIPSIKAQLAKTKQNRINTWGYFVAGIIADNAKTGEIQPAIDEAKWKERLNLARRKKLWDPKWCPMPGQNGCLVPQALLLPDDGNGWGIWRPEA